MLSFACVLKSGGDYKKEDAIILSRQVYRHLRIPHKFVCMSDVEIFDPLIEWIPLNKNWQGWWSVIELFKLVGPVVATGLDTIIVDNIDRAGELALTCPEDVFYMTRPQPRARQRGEKWCSGMMIWNGDWSWIMKEFDYARHRNIFVKEQRYTTSKLRERKTDVRLFQDYFDGFYSYKNDCKENGVPEDAKIVAFHGHPRPSQCQEQWIKDIRSDLSIERHPFEKEDYTNHV